VGHTNKHIHVNDFCYLRTRDSENGCFISSAFQRLAASGFTAWDRPGRAARGTPTLCKTPGKPWVLPFPSALCQDLRGENKKKKVELCTLLLSARSESSRVGEKHCVYTSSPFLYLQHMILHPTTTPGFAVWEKEL